MINKKSVILILVAVLFVTAGPAVAGNSWKPLAEMEINYTPEKKELSPDKTMKYKNMFRVHGGVGYGSREYYENMLMMLPVQASVGFSYQRDILRRLSVELEFGGTYMNSFPREMHTVFPLISNQDINKELWALMYKYSLEGKYHVNFYKVLTYELTFRPVFHMISNSKHRFSVYVGIGYVKYDCTEFRFAWHTIGDPESFGTRTAVAYPDALSCDYGLRYSYTLFDKYCFGIDVGRRRNVPWIAVPILSDNRVELSFGIRF